MKPREEEDWSDVDPVSGSRQGLSLPMEAEATESPRPTVGSPGIDDSESSPFSQRDGSTRESESQQMQDDWQESLAYQENIMHAHRTAPEVEGRWTDRFMKLMVVGESGQGKTTFIRNMFMSYVDSSELGVADGSITSMAEFVDSPQNLCTTFQVDNEEEMVRYHFTVQDTPGYGDDLNTQNNLEVLVSYVQGCHGKFYELEEEHGRLQADSNDCRVDACLYFISAHRLKPMDVEFMAALAPHVAIIPIIAKADSMTTEEIQAYRTEVRARLSATDKGGPGPVPIFNFSKEALEAAGIRDTVPPFAMVSSNVVDETVGPFWPVRKYSWGTCEAFRAKHSDFGCLKRLVLELSHWDIRDATEKRYMEYRKERREKEKSAPENATPAFGMKQFLLSLLTQGSETVQQVRTQQPVTSPTPTQPLETATGNPPAAHSWVYLVALVFVLCLSGVVLPLPCTAGINSPEHLLEDMRDLEDYIMQLRDKSMAVLQAHGPGCLAETLLMTEAAEQLEETVDEYGYGSVCYDEEYQAGTPYLARLLVPACIAYTVWSLSSSPQLRAIELRQLRVGCQMALYLAGLYCQYHLLKLLGEE